MRFPSPAVAALLLVPAIASCADPPGHTHDAAPRTAVAQQSAEPRSAKSGASSDSVRVAAAAGAEGAEVIPFDPLGGVYPQVMWMFNVYAVPCELAVSPAGQVQPSAAVKANRIAVVESGGIDALFQSIEALAGCSLISAPAIIAALDQEAAIEPGSVDKPGQPLSGRSIAVRATEEAAGLRTRLEVSVTSGAFSVSSTAGRELVSAGGALVMIAPAAREGEPCTLVVARPSILRSVADYPFQTSSALP